MTLKKHRTARSNQSKTGSVQWTDEVTLSCHPFLPLYLALEDFGNG